MELQNAGTYRPFSVLEKPSNSMDVDNLAFHFILFFLAIEASHPIYIYVWIYTCVCIYVCIL